MTTQHLSVLKWTSIARIHKWSDFNNFKTTFWSLENFITYEYQWNRAAKTRERQERDKRETRERQERELERRYGAIKKNWWQQTNGLTITEFLVYLKMGQIPSDERLLIDQILLAPPFFSKLNKIRRKSMFASIL